MGHNIHNPKKASEAYLQSCTVSTPFLAFSKLGHRESAEKMLATNMRSSRRWNSAVVLLGVATLTVVTMVAVNISTRVHDAGEAVAFQATDPAISLADAVGNKLHLLMSSTKSAVPQIRRRLLQDEEEDGDEDEDEDKK